VSRPTAAATYDDAMVDRPPLGFLMNHLAADLRDRTKLGLAEFDLSPREYGLLWRLANQGPLSQRQLGELHRIDRTTVVAVIDRLESDELVARTIDPDDRRRHALRLTTHGREVFAAATPAVQRTEAEFTAALTDDERRALSQALVAVLDAEVEP